MVLLQMFFKPDDDSAFNWSIGIMLTTRIRYTGSRLCYDRRNTHECITKESWIEAVRVRDANTSTGSICSRV